MVCPVCKDSEEIFVSLQADRRKGLQGKWEYHACKSCGLIFISPLPRSEDLGGYYSNNSISPPIDFSSGRGARFPALRKAFHFISGDVDPRDFIGATKGMRVLDFGCGYAGYLSDFHARGVRISGAEIAGSLVDACNANGLDVRKVDDINRIPFEDCEFDIVYLMQVFEHLRDPIGFMRELNRILKPDGKVYIALPNNRSVWRKVFGINWVSGWFAPFHLYHFDRETLSRMARQYGFEPTSCWTRTPESWFRLNLKAFIYPEENKLDLHRSWFDISPVRFVFMLTLRIFELLVRERDCLVMKLEKQLR
jgi:SAM-dependent methyltransferase